MLVYKNDFSGESSGAMPGLINYNGGTFEVSGGNIAETSVVDGSVCLLKSIPQLANFDIKYTFDPSGAAGTTSLLFRMNSDYTNGYILIVRADHVRLYKRQSGVNTLIAQSSGGGFSFTGSDLVHIRIVASGTSISAKVWKNAGAEPGSYLHAFSDGTFSAAGYFGFYQSLNSGTAAALTEVGYVKDTTSKDATAVTESSLYFSPYNWNTVGNNRMQTAAAGAYFKANFTGTSFTAIFDTYLLSATNGATSNWPRLVYQIDGGAWQSTQINQNIMALASGLSAGSHTIRCALKMIIETYDRWTGPDNALRLLAVAVDTGSSISTPTIKTKKAIFFGDSITEGFRVNGSNSSTDGDSTKDYAFLLGDDIDVEFGVIAYSGQGWSDTGQGNVPTFTDAWDYHSSGVSRLVGGVFSSTPDYIFINHGANDTGVADATLRSVVTATLAEIRTAAPTSEIFLIMPFGQGRTKLTAITNGENDFGDENVIHIDLGASGVTWATLNPTYSYDGIHPNGSGYINIANALYDLIAPYVSTNRHSASGRIVKAGRLATSLRSIINNRQLL